MHTEDSFVRTFGFQGNTCALTLHAAMPREQAGSKWPGLPFRAAAAQGSRASRELCRFFLWHGGRFPWQGGGIHHRFTLLMKPRALALAVTCSVSQANLASRTRSLVLCSCGTVKAVAPGVRGCKYPVQDMVLESLVLLSSSIYYLLGSTHATAALEFLSLQLLARVELAGCSS